MQPEQSKWRKVIPTVAAVGGALVGAAVDPFLGPLAAAGFGALGEKIAEDRLNRMRQLLQETQHEAGLASDEITKVLIDDRLKRGLFEHAVTVAASSQNHAKITLLAKVLGRALTSTDDPRIDRADLLIGMIAQLEQPHVEVLAVMASEAHPGGRTAWPQFAIADKRPNMSQILSPLLKRLEGLGLIEDTITGGTTTQETRHLSAWVFTSFGQDLVTFLRSMPIDDESTQPLADQELGADED